MDQAKSYFINRRSLNLLFALLFNLIAYNLQAIDFKAGDNITIDSILNSDSYIAGKTLIVNAPVRGDLCIAGQNISIRDSIAGDLAAAGEIILVEGFMNDDLRAAGRMVTLNSHVKGDVIIFSADAIISERAIIEGNLVVFSGNVEVRGLVKGNIIVRGGNVKLKGSVEGRVEIKARELEVDAWLHGPSTIVAEKIILGTNAKFLAKVNYWKRDGEIPSDTAIFSGGLVYDPSLAPKETEGSKSMWMAGIGFIIWHLLFAILLILLLMFLMPLLFKNAGIYLGKDPAKSFGLGMLYFIGAPFIIFFLFITLIGIPIAMLLFFFYIFTFIAGLVIASLVIANFINHKYSKGWNRWMITGMALLVLLALHFILVIPVLGFLTGMLLVASSFGALLLNIRRRATKQIS